MSLPQSRFTNATPLRNPSRFWKNLKRSSAKNLKHPLSASGALTLIPEDHLGEIHLGGAFLRERWTIIEREDPGRLPLATSESCQPGWPLRTECCQSHEHDRFGTSPLKMAAQIPLASPLESRGAGTPLVVVCTCKPTLETTTRRLGSARLGSAQLSFSSPSRSASPRQICLYPKIVSPTAATTWRDYSWSRLEW